ncbi:MAG: metallophosphoesterase, partial [Candidatus Omnitrophota bacterium]
AEVICFVGDYFDRGPRKGDQNVEVIEVVMAFIERYKTSVAALLGNHDSKHREVFRIIGKDRTKDNPQDALQILGGLLPEAREGIVGYSPKAREQILNTMRQLYETYGSYEGMVKWGVIGFLENLNHVVVIDTLVVTHARCPQFDMVSGDEKTLEEVDQGIQDAYDTSTTEDLFGAEKYAQRWNGPNAEAAAAQKERTTFYDVIGRASASRGGVRPKAIAVGHAYQAGEAWGEAGMVTRGPARGYASDAFFLDGGMTDFYGATIGAYGGILDIDAEGNLWVDQPLAQARAEAFAKRKGQPVPVVPARRNLLTPYDQPTDFFENANARRERDIHKLTVEIDDLEKAIRDAERKPAPPAPLPDLTKVIAAELLAASQRAEAAVRSAEAIFGDIKGILPTRPAGARMATQAEIDEAKVKLKALETLRTKTQAQVDDDVDVLESRKARGEVNDTTVQSKKDEWNAKVKDIDKIITDAKKWIADAEKVIIVYTASDWNAIPRHSLTDSKGRNFQVTIDKRNEAAGLGIDVATAIGTDESRLQVLMAAAGSVGLTQAQVDEIVAVTIGINEQLGDLIFFARFKNELDQLITPAEADKVWGPFTGRLLNPAIRPDDMTAIRKLVAAEVTANLGIPADSKDPLRQRLMTSGEDFNRLADLCLEAPTPGGHSLVLVSLKNAWDNSLVIEDTYSDLWANFIYETLPGLSADQRRQMLVELDAAWNAGRITSISSLRKKIKEIEDRIKPKPKSPLDRLRDVLGSEPQWTAFETRIGRNVGKVVDGIEQETLLWRMFAEFEAGALTGPDLDRVYDQTLNNCLKDLAEEPDQPLMIQSLRDAVYHEMRAAGVTGLERDAGVLPILSAEEVIM